MKAHRIAIQHPSRLEWKERDGGHLLLISGQNPALEVPPKFMKTLRLITHLSLTCMCLRDQTQCEQEQHPGDMNPTEFCVIGVQAHPAPLIIKE